MGKPSDVATHLPALHHVLRHAGSIRSILEVGAGFYSTPLLSCHAAAVGGEHVVLESKPAWAKQVLEWYDVEAEPFTIGELPEWVLQRPWDLAFIDNAVADSRPAHALALIDCAKIVMLHDSNPDWDAEYRYSTVIGRWKHHRQFKACYPWTILLTNDDEVWRRLTDNGR